MSRWNPLSPEEKEIAYKARQQRYLERNREKRRETWRTYRKKKLAGKAIADGRQPGKIGRPARLTEEERLARSRSKSLQYWIKNPGKRREQYDRYYRDNKEKILAASRNKRARRNLAHGTHSADDIKVLLEKQKGKCPVCLKVIKGSNFHIDHYMPLILGGSNDATNLRLLHPRCNRVKGPKHPIDHALSQGMLCW